EDLGLRALVVLPRLKLPAVHEYGRGAAHAELLAQHLVRGDGRGVLVALQARAELVAVETDGAGVADQQVGRRALAEGPLLLVRERDIVVLPELALVARAARRPRDDERVRMAGEREVVVDELHLAVRNQVGLERLLDIERPVLAARALEVTEDEHLDRRIVLADRNALG